MYMTHVQQNSIPFVDSLALNQIKQSQVSWYNKKITFSDNREKKISIKSASLLKNLLKCKF